MPVPFPVTGDQSVNLWTDPFFFKFDGERFSRRSVGEIRQTRRMLQNEDLNTLLVRVRALLDKCRSKPHALNMGFVPTVYGFRNNLRSGIFRCAIP